MSDKWRVLLISDSTLPRHDGIATSLRALTQILYSLGFPATLIGTATGREFYPHAKVISVPAITTYCGYPLAWPADRSLWQAIRSCDIVHVHTLGPLGITGLLLAKAHRRPVMLSIHTDFDVYATHYPIIRIIARILSIIVAQRTRTGALHSIIRVAGAFADVLVLPVPSLVADCQRLRAISRGL